MQPARTRSVIGMTPPPTDAGVHDHLPIGAKQQARPECIGIDVLERVRAQIDHHEIGQGAGSNSTRVNPQGPGATRGRHIQQHPIDSTIAITPCTSTFGVQSMG